MPFPDIDPAFETFLEPTRIFLFGKPFPALEYNPTYMIGGVEAAARVDADSEGVAPEEAAAGEFEDFTVPESAYEALKDDRPKEAVLPMPPGPVERALRAVQDKGIFARIYGFSFEGHYYKLPRPILFLVRGASEVGDGVVRSRSRSPEGDSAGRGDRFDTRFTGVEGKDWQFGSDIRVWAVDKYDIAVCLDLEVGRYEEVLLQSLAAAQEEGAFRSSWGNAGVYRNAASFRTSIVPRHQDR